MEGSVLFVDDEKMILHSIRRAMRIHDFEIHFAESGREALNILETESIDIIVSDMRMPEMSGIELLEKVKDKYPKIYRLILSGQVDKKDVLKAILSGTAFEYLTKPWSNELLLSKLDHIMDIRKVLGNERVTNLINGISHLPKNFDILKDFEKAVDKQESIDKITDIVISDISITTKVLQMANSAYYTSKKISSVKEALTRLGLNSVKGLIFTSIFMEENNLSTWQNNKLEKIMAEILNVNRKFIHNYKEEIGTDLPEEFSTLALLHNIGKIIILVYFPERHNQILKSIEEKEIDYHLAELELGLQGETHNEIGAYFLDLWNFSKYNVEAALFHNNIEKASESLRQPLRILERTSREVNSDLVEI